MEIIMKKIIFYISVILGFTVTSCHKPEFIKSNITGQGISSLTAIITTGRYTNMELAKFSLSEEMYKSDTWTIELPWYYPESSDDETMAYLTSLKIQAEILPNFRLEPGLGILDLTEDNVFTLTEPSGQSRRIIIKGERVHSSKASIVSFSIDNMVINGIVYEKRKEILIPYTGDLSGSVISAQVSAHSKLTHIGEYRYVPGKQYNIADGTKIKVLADDQKSVTEYTLKQGEPETIDYGLNPKSVHPLFTIDPTTLYGFPAYTELSFVSLASADGYLVVCLGNGTTPMTMNRFSGEKKGEIVLGTAVADVISNDEKENLLIANKAKGGADAEVVNIYRTKSVKTAPSLFYSFTNPASEPIGHRMKVLGDIDKNAVIVFTAEGIDGVTTTAKAVVLTVTDGAVSKVETKDFSSCVAGWGSAPVGHATVIPASLKPEADGYFLDYYEGNVDPAISGDAENYLLHYIDGKGKDNWIAHIGNWGNNPNCLDIKTFNGARYMAHFVVSHFPQWGISPGVYLYEATEPSSASLIFSNTSIKAYQVGSNSSTGAAGDVILCPTADGYRIYMYFYDYHCQSIGAYVADCIKIEE